MAYCMHTHPVRPANGSWDYRSPEEKGQCYSTSSIIDGDWKVEWVACGYRTVGQVGAHRSEAVSWGEKQSAIAADPLRSGDARARSRRRWGSARNGMASLRRETRNRMASLRSEKLRWRTCAESCGLGSWREIVDPCWRACEAPGVSSGSSSLAAAASDKKDDRRGWRRHVRAARQRR